MSLALSICAVVLPPLGVFLGMTLPVVVPRPVQRIFPEMMIGLIVIGSFISAFVLLFIRAVIWRCPACGRELGGGLGQRFCAKCGIALYDEHEEAGVYEESDS